MEWEPLYAPVCLFLWIFRAWHRQPRTRLTWLKHSLLSIKHINSHHPSVSMRLLTQPCGSGPAHPDRTRAGPSPSQRDGRTHQRVGKAVFSLAAWKLFKAVVQGSGVGVPSICRCGSDSSRVKRMRGTAHTSDHVKLQLAIAHRIGLLQLPISPPERPSRRCFDSWRSMLPACQTSSAQASRGLDVGTR